MMLDQRGERCGFERSENFADDFGVLLDDGRERNDVNHALLAVSEGMPQCEAEGRKSFSATCGNGEGEDSGRLCYSGATVIDDLAALEVDLVSRCRRAELIDSRINQIGDGGERVLWCLVPSFRLRWIHECLGGEEIPIDKA